MERTTTTNNTTQYKYVLKFTIQNDHAKEKTQATTAHSLVDIQLNIYIIYTHTCIYIYIFIYICIYAYILCFTIIKYKQKKTIVCIN